MKLLRSLLLVLPILVILTAAGCDTGPKQKYAIIETNLGSFKIELFHEDSPKTVENFIKLAEDNYYNDVIFHRIMKQFMIQTGNGGAVATFDDELPVKRSYEPGIVAMANRGPNTNTSQFFICTGPQAKALDQNPVYTQFGRVVEGMDVVNQIAAMPVTRTPSGELSQPINPPYIKSVTIAES